MLKDIIAGIRSKLATQGYVRMRPDYGELGFRKIADALGVIVGEEVIELRSGAHAYVAKPGPVPLHTDQPQIEIVCWFCIEQDAIDGCSILFDSHHVLAVLGQSEKELLGSIQLFCPPVVGGPPSLQFPVLRLDGERELVFCPPWLQPVSSSKEHHEAFRLFYEQLVKAAMSDPVSIRLAAGDALFVDNQRVLHGRNSISDRSRRRLQRLWIIGHETAAKETAGAIVP